MMKKTLVAMALAATMASGSAMAAWTVGSLGGSVELGGTLTPPPPPSPWEVLIGAAVTNLNGNTKVGDNTVNIPLTAPITVLGIRTVSNQPVPGKVGISPQIDYGKAIDRTQFKKGVTMLTLDITDGQNTKIGQMTAPLSAAAIVSLGSPFDGQFSMNAQTAPRGFYGGVGNDFPNIVDTGDNAKALLDQINTEFTANYNSQNQASKGGGMSYSFDSGSFSSAYGSGIMAGESIQLTLTSPASYSVINWKASLPITVSYQ